MSQPRRQPCWALTPHSMQTCCRGRPFRFAKWRGATFLRSLPFVNITNIKPIQEWAFSDFISYMYTYAVPPSTVSIVFACLSAVALIAFCFWRPIRLCLGCCGVYRPDPKVDRQAILASKPMLAIKIIGVISALLVVIAAIVGLVRTVPAPGIHVNIVQQGWETTSALIAYVSTLLTSWNEFSVAVGQLIMAVNATIALATSFPGFPPLPDDSKVIGSVETLAGVVTTVDDFTYSMNSSVVGDYLTAQANWENKTLYLWDILITITQVVYGVVLLFTTLWCISATVNNKLGVSLNSGTQGVFSLIFMALCIFLAIGLASIRDWCNDMEGIITEGVAPASLVGMFKYYLNWYSDPILEEGVLSNFLANQTQIQAAINATLAYKDALVSWSANLPPVDQAQLNASITNVTAAAGVVLADLGLHGGNTGPFYLSSLAVVQSNYGQAKVYICCIIPGQGYGMWLTLTILGWGSLFLLATGIALLALMDRIPDSRQCCPCDCFRPFSPVWNRETKASGMEEAEDDHVISNPLSEEMDPGVDGGSADLERADGGSRRQGSGYGMQRRGDSAADDDWKGL